MSSPLFRARFLIALTLSIAPWPYCVSAQTPLSPAAPWSGNNHSYQVFQVPLGISWSAAQAYATSVGGYLATVTSAAENAHIYSLIGSVPSLWFTVAGSGTYGPWIGCSLAGSWSWVSGEGFSYTNWLPGEPNNSCMGQFEDRMHFASNTGAPEDKWNDFPDAGCSLLGVPRGFVVEYDVFPLASVTTWSGNLHGYQVFCAPGGISWSAARAYATSIGGYLVTMTSASENAFVFSLVANQLCLWHIYPQNSFGPWVGGTLSGSSWGWVTGEPFSYTNWLVGEPNNGCSGQVETRLHFANNAGTTAANWNDFPDTGCAAFSTVPKGFIVEFPPPASACGSGSAGSRVLWGDDFENFGGVGSPIGPYTPGPVGTFGNSSGGINSPTNGGWDAWYRAAVGDGGIATPATGHAIGTKSLEISGPGVAGSGCDMVQNFGIATAVVGNPGSYNHAASTRGRRPIARSGPSGR